NYTPGSGVDPFSMTPLPISGNAEILIKYHMVMASTGSHVDKVEVLPPHLQPVNRYNRVVDTMLRECMQNKLKLTSLLMIMSARMVHLSRIPLVGSAQPEHYMQMTLTSVRQKMLECQQKGIRADPLLVQNIHGLALAAWICQHFEEASTHIRAAKSLLGLLDMNDHYHKFTAQGLVNIDMMISIETGCLPDLPLMFDPGPLTPSRLAVIKEEIANLAAGRSQPTVYLQSPGPRAAKLSNALISHQVDILADASAILDSRLGRGFEQALEANFISPALASILRDMLDCVAVAKYVWRTSSATREDAEWMCRRMRAICHRLLHLPAESPMLARKDEALRLSLLLVVLRCTNRMAFRSAQPNMRRLQRVLFGIHTNWCPPSFLSQSHSQTPEYEENAPNQLQDPTAFRPLPKISGTISSVSCCEYNENALLLWTLMTGHFNAQGQPEEAWFLLCAAFVARQHLGIFNYGGLEEFMTDFLFSKTQQRHSLEAVA
ncbi:uncharacterized protein A1O9_10485, partial [Exophiala aquamarina CBS 119918]